MQMSNGRKAFYITVSILIAFVLWFYVNNGSSVDYSINGIPVEFLNADSALANKGLMLIDSDEEPTVDLVLNMPRRIIYGFDVNRMRIIADLGSVNSTGTQSVNYSIVYPPNVNRSQISVRSPSVQNVSVQIGELFRSNVEIRCKLVGNVADGFVAGGVQLLPDVLEIWGQQSDVMKVSYAQVTLNIDNASSTIVELLEYELYDHNDKLIENKGIHAGSDKVQVTMPVISATDIPLVVNLLEEPGVRADSFEYSMDTQSITLSGDANQIAQIGEIVLGQVRLSEIEGEQTFTYDIPIPEGLTNLSGVTTATLTIRNRDVATKDLTVTNFGYENFNAEGRDVEVVTSSLDVTLRGTKAALEQANEETVRAVADLSGVNDASGTYTVPAILRVEGEPDIGATGEYQLTIRISQHEVEQEPGGEAENETEEDKEG